MSGEWIQDLVVGAAGVTALGWLGRRAWRARKSDAPCPSCPVAGNCHAAKSAPAPQLVQIEGFGSSGARPAPPAAR